MQAEQDDKGDAVVRLIERGVVTWHHLQMGYVLCTCLSVKGAPVMRMLMCCRTSGIQG